MLRAGGAGEAVLGIGLASKAVRSLFEVATKAGVIETSRLLVKAEQLHTDVEK